TIYDVLPGIGFIFALIVAIGTLQFSRNKIRELDEKRVDLTYQQKLDQQPSAGDWWSQSQSKWEGRGVAWSNREATHRQEHADHRKQTQHRTETSVSQDEETDNRGGWATYHRK
ncbi:MAG: hypothetical protein VX239_02025, partial [Candidatus Thermoplasmatota archaeon]|nr:hypothetical protein [Candidatus Thermoplasmatota archaeon]